MILIMLAQLFADVPGAAVAEFSAGAAIFRQGDRADAIFQVRDGAVSLVRHLEDGVVLTVATARSNDTFAEASLFGSTYHCDAIARARTSVLVLPSAAIRFRLAADPAVALAFAEFLANQVRDLRTRIEIQHIKRAPARVMAWLRWRARGDPATLEAPDAWLRVSSELGLTPESFYRTLSALEKAGAIERQGRRITIHSNGVD